MKYAAILVHRKFLCVKQWKGNESGDMKMSHFVSVVFWCRRQTTMKWATQQQPPMCVLCTSVLVLSRLHCTLFVFWSYFLRLPDYLHGSFSMGFCFVLDLNHSLYINNSLYINKSVITVALIFLVFRFICWCCLKTLIHTHIINWMRHSSARAHRSWPLLPFNKAIVAFFVSRLLNPNVFNITHLCCFFNPFFHLAYMRL